MRCSRMNRRDFLRLGGASVAGASLLGMYGCGGGSSSAAVEWTTWGNAGETARFRQYTQDFSQRKDFQVSFEPIPNVDEYDSRLLTEFNSGDGPDLFYTSDTNIGNWIDRGVIREITEMLTGPESKSPPAQVFSGIWGGSQPRPGTYYGMPVDCNPYIFWYNKKVLREAGINDEPAELFERGEWNWDTFQNMLEQVRRSGKDGFVQGSPGAETFSWATANGGQIVEDGRFVLHEDEKSVEAHNFIFDNVQSGNMVYSATLSGNQGAESLFISNEVAFVTAGRWFLPLFREAKGLEFDIVPWPTNTGNKMEPVSNAGAFMVMSSEAADPERAFQFLTNYVSKEGQIFRLRGSGNAVPSVKGADEVVLEGDLPGNARYFLDAREIGYAFPAELSTVPSLNDDLIEALDPVFVNGGDIEAELAAAGEEANRKIREQASE